VPDRENGKYLTMSASNIKAFRIRKSYSFVKSGT
jgi:hypothetical protein